MRRIKFMTAGFPRCRIAISWMFSASALTSRATRSLVTPGNGLIIFQGMQDSTAESIKSLEGFDVAWVEEAQTLSARSLSLLRPTIRKDGVVGELEPSHEEGRH